MNWPNRLSLAIAYIEDNLAADIDIEQAAALAACSKYHFHRLFFAYCNVTFAEYVRRRRLTLAASELVSSKTKVMDIAVKYGYDSPNAFTRAFRKLHGINPNQARNSQAKLASYQAIDLSLQIAGVEKVDYRIVEKPAFKLVGKSKTFTFEEFTKQGSKFWKSYVTSTEYKSLCKLTNGVPGPSTGAPLLTAYFPQESDKQKEFIDLLGVENTSESTPSEFEEHIVPAATYAEFECSYTSSMKTNRYIYGEWFSATGYERDKGKPDIVAYFPMPWLHFSAMGVRWWVPIVKN